MHDFTAAVFGEVMDASELYDAGENKRKTGANKIVKRRGVRHFGDVSSVIDIHEAHRQDNSHTWIYFMG